MALIKSINLNNLIAPVAEKAEKLKKVHRILILVLTILLFGGGFFSLVYLPKTSAIAETKQEVSNLETKLLAAKGKARNLAKLEADNKKAIAQLKEALKLLPDKREIPSLLRNISSLGKESRLEFPLFNPQGERPQAFYMEIPVNIVLSGKYNDVATFFHKVGSMDRIVNIHGISMKPEKEMSTTLVTKCTAVTYRFKSEAEKIADRKKKAKKGK